MISLKNIVSFIGFKDFNVKNNLLKPRKKNSCRWPTWKQGYLQFQLQVNDFDNFFI